MHYMLLRTTPSTTTDNGAIIGAEYRTNKARVSRARASEAVGYFGRTTELVQSKNNV